MWKVSEHAQEHAPPFRAAVLDIKSMRRQLQTVSGELMQKNRGVFQVDADMGLYQEERYFVNSEGSKIYTSDFYYSFLILAKMFDRKNFLVPHHCVWTGRDPLDMPSYEEMMDKGERAIAELMEIVTVPVQPNGSYPAILDYINHGVLWHEMMGHGLEGHRMEEDEGGDTVSLFDAKIGKRIAPEFLSLYDDPTDRRFFGYYPYDEEGVIPQRVTLVKNGILKNYLQSRQSAGYFTKRNRKPIHSNGHARAENSEQPVARMGTLIVESSNAVGFDELVENLAREVVDAKKPYGLILMDSDAGLAMPDESFYNTFPSNVFRVYRDGSRKRVRGVYIVGTPYQTLSNILQTSDCCRETTAFCGAESGWVRTAEVVPDVLVRAVDVNRLPNSAYEKRRKAVMPDRIV